MVVEYVCETIVEQKFFVAGMLFMFAWFVCVCLGFKIFRRFNKGGKNMFGKKRKLIDNCYHAATDTILVNGETVEKCKCGCWDRQLTLDEIEGT